MAGRVPLAGGRSPNPRALDVPVGHLSRGQRQAIALARSIHSAPEILLLDKPIASRLSYLLGR